MMTSNVVYIMGMINPMGCPLSRSCEAKVAINPKSTCPAVMLAANRKAKVRGRTNDLNISIKIINGPNMPAPWGK